MRKIDLLIGALIGIFAAAIGSLLFIAAFTEYGLVEGIEMIHQQGNMGKLLTLGAILNLFIFFGLLKANKEMTARGVVLGTIILTLITLFV